jgi:hypothetical protein
VGLTIDSISLFFFGWERKVYMAGITKSVKIRENTIPPTMTTPRGILLVAAAPSDKARGRAPNAMAKLVIKMGLNLCPAA